MRKQVKKRGQLTIFIIVGIVIVLGIGGVYMISNDISIGRRYDPEVNTLKSNILDCLSEEYITLVETNSFQGGYFERPDTEFYDVGTYFVPYYYFEGENYFPSLEDLQFHLGEGAKDYVESCIQEFNTGIFSISYSDFAVRTRIFENKIEFVTDIELTTQYHNKSVSVEFKDDEIFLDTKLDDIYILSEKIVNQALNDPEEWIDLTEIYEESVNRDLNVTIIDIDEVENAYLFIIDTNTEEFYPTTFQFLNKYNLIDIPFPSAEV